MSSFNRVVLMGNLTRDPEMRQTSSGAQVAELRLAVSETYRDRQTNQPKEVTCYVDVVVWNKLAELCQQYLTKGRSVLVEGRLTYDEWKTPQGEARNKLRVRADAVKFIGSPKRGEAQDGAAAVPARAAAAVSTQTAMASAGQDVAPAEPADTDDMPF
ncbi:MAG: single-stranded DNA-binding protein [bacterium]